MDSNSYHALTIGPISRKLPLFEVSPGTAIAVLNILGDVELVETAATLLSQRLSVIGHDLLLTPETKSIPLAHALAKRLNCPYVVLRKTRKSYMGEVLRVTSHSITTGEPQHLFLDAKDQDLLCNRRVILIDDVISTGSTLRAMSQIAEKASAQIVAQAAICTEGSENNWPDVISLAHLPVFETE